VVALLDLVAAAAVIAALAFLLRPRKRPACGDCAPTRKAEARVPLSELRASARRASRRQ
jgi:hypothetical protein